MIVRCKDKPELFINVPPIKLVQLGYFVVEPDPCDLNEKGEMEVSEQILLDIYEYANK